MSRVDTPEQDRRDFYLYADEFQQFATESFANILSEARKYHLCLIVGHQYIKQLDETVADAIFGNVGTIVAFRVGAEDAEFLEKWFAPDFMAADIVNLGKYNIYIKLMVDGITSRGFSAGTLPPFPKMEESHTREIIDYSRQMYGTPREVVEKTIAEWATPLEPSFPSGPSLTSGAAKRRRRSGGGGGGMGGSQDMVQRMPPSPPVKASATSAGAEPKGISLAALAGEGSTVVDFRQQKIKKFSNPKGAKPLDTAELKRIIDEALKK